MISNHDMHHNQHEAMNMGGVTDPFSQDTTGLPEAIAPGTIVLRPNEVFKPISNRRSTGTACGWTTASMACHRVPTRG
jgi:hypothetical protein